MFRRHAWIAAFLIVAVVVFQPAALIAATTQSEQAAKPAAPLVNLNTATLAQLQGLPGVGPKTAQRIVEHRQKNGTFKKIEELMNVKGIGEKAFLKLKPLITVAAPKA